MPSKNNINHESNKNTEKKVIIIGAGLGGLAVACRLAKIGFQVTVFEKSDCVGGKAGSLILETKKGNFRFDTGPSLMTMKEVFQDLFEFCGEKLEQYLDLEELTISTKYFFEDGSTILGYKNRNRLIHEVTAKTHTDKISLEKYLDQNQKIYELTKEVFLDNEIGIGTLLKPKFWQGLWNIRLLSPWQSMHSQNQNTLKDYRLVQIADRYATFNGSNPYKTPATLNVIAHLDLSMPTYFPKKGIYAISQSIQSLALKMGVKIFCGSTAVAIEHGSEAPAKKDHPKNKDHYRLGQKTNKISGVWIKSSTFEQESTIDTPFLNTKNLDKTSLDRLSLGGGVLSQRVLHQKDFDQSLSTKTILNKKNQLEVGKEDWEAGLKGGGLEGDLSFVSADLLISNVDILTTYLGMLQENNYGQVKKRLKQEFSSSTLVYYWAVDRNSQDLDVHNILFSPDYQKEFEDIFGTDGFSCDPTVYIHIGSKVDKESAPVGCESWFVMINVGPDNGQDWKSIAEQLKPVIYQKINRLIFQKNGNKESIQDLILAESVLTPDLVAKNTGSYKGSLYGLSSNNPFSAFQRYPNKSRKYSNLYFVGGSTHPGGGMPLVLNSAKIVANKILKNMG